MPVELALFRILQESLTNIHRHSGSSTVEVNVEVEMDVVTLAVRDAGRGIPPHVLDHFTRPALPELVSQGCKNVSPIWAANCEFSRMRRALC